jgi:hypothetical protein
MAGLFFTRGSTAKRTYFAFGVGSASGVELRGRVSSAALARRDDRSLASVQSLGRSQARHDECDSRVTPPRSPTRIAERRHRQPRTTAPRTSKSPLPRRPGAASEGTQKFGSPAFVIETPEMSSAHVQAFERSESHTGLGRPFRCRAPTKPGASSFSGHRTSSSRRGSRCIGRERSGVTHHKGHPG